jgi:hypothetical protein
MADLGSHNFSIDAHFCMETLLTTRSLFNLLVPELLFFLILAHPVYKIVNNTGTKYVRIMKQTTF